MVKINLFIPITPYTLSIAETLVSSQGVKEENILINPHNITFNEKLWDKVYVGNCSRVVNNSRILRLANFAYQILVFARLYRKIKHLRNNTFNFYYVDLAHVLSNAIFFDFKGIKKSFILEDGLLNYYCLTLKGKMLAKPYVNSFLRVLGLPTQKFEGDITGIDRKDVTGQYVYFPEQAFMASKSLQIPYEKLHYATDEIFLLLGQEPIVSMISTEEYLKALEKIILRCTGGNKIKRFYYKPHHHGRQEIAKGLLLNMLGSKIVFIDDFAPIHEIIHSIQPSTVLSFGSTASLNLRLILPEEVKNTVYLIRHRNLSRNLQLEKLFLRTGVEIEELKVI
ncbi:MAG: polysialyltransferase family glycosyltransferase [Cellulophaga sp.]